MVQSSDQCLTIPKAARMIWTLFIVLLITTLVIGVIGKTIVSCSKSSPRYLRQQETCQRAEVVTSLLVTTTAGSIISIIIYYVVNITLVEITLSPFYAFIFGMLLIFVGLLLFWQALGSYFDFYRKQISLAYVISLSCFALLIISSGVTCFLLEKDWTNTLSIKAKVPLYALLGVSIAFSVVYSTTDIVNQLLLRFYQVGKVRPFVQSVAHVQLLTLTAVICGLYYGWVFGMLDLEDVNRTSLELFLQKESFYCYPMAAGLGGLSAFILHYKSLSATPQRTEMRYIDNQGDDL